MKMAEAVVMIILELILLLSLPFLSRDTGDSWGLIVILILPLAVSNAIALVHC
ncbi:MAG: hypothetical protein ACLPY5_04035 [Candidatus Bathyarchaeia archaeon]